MLGMQGTAAILACLVLLSRPPPAMAADQPVAPARQPAASGPTWSWVGTIAPTWTDNALLSRNNKRDDFFLEPDVSLRLDGRLSADVSYRLWLRTLFESFSRVKDANESSARIGGRLARNIAGWIFTASYEHRHEFGGVYTNRLFVANDVSGSVARSFTSGNVTMAPTVLLQYRFADLAAARRYRLDLILPIEIRFDERWSVLATPMAELFWFTDGVNSGRRDQIYSTSLGLRYRISGNVSLTNSVLYERRVSNVPIRHFQNLEVGPKLDFAF
jgi:hypothetical protein